MNLIPELGVPFWLVNFCTAHAKLKMELFTNRIVIFSANTSTQTMGPRPAAAATAATPAVRTVPQYKYAAGVRNPQQHLNTQPQVAMQQVCNFRYCSCFCWVFCRLRVEMCVIKSFLCLSRIQALHYGTSRVWGFKYVSSSPGMGWDPILLCFLIWYLNLNFPCDCSTMEQLMLISSITRSEPALFD